MSGFTNPVLSTGQIAYLANQTPGTAKASAALILDANKHQDVSLVADGGLKLGATGSEVAIDATALEINRVADLSANLVAATGSTLAVTVAAHAGRTINLDRAAGIAVTLPPALGTGAIFRFAVKTAFTADATIKVTTTDTMVGLVLGLDGDGAPANAWTVGGTNDTITFDGSATPNMTQGGFAGDFYEIQDIGAALWLVRGFIKQTGTEATPMSATVS